MKSPIDFYRTLIVIGLLMLVGNALAQDRQQGDSPDQYGDSPDEVISYPSYSSQESGYFLDPDKIKPGKKIRLHMMPGIWVSKGKGGRLEGRFHSFENGILSLSVDGTDVKMPIGEIYRWEVHTGGVSGAWPGALLGLIGGTLIAVAAKPDRSSESFGGLAHMGEDLATGSVIVLAGVVIGAGIGAGMDSGKKWKKVNFQHQKSGQVGRVGSDYRLAYSLRF